MAPSNSAAWITAAKKIPLEVREAPYPSVGDEEIVVKNHAVAINPVDWKVQEYIPIPLTYPYILGCDVAGEVVETGSKVKGFNLGDRVIGHANSLVNGRSETGAFQKYTAIHEKLAAKIPTTLDFAQASVLPLALSTAAAALYQKEDLGLPYPTVPDAKSTGQVILVWGGSSSVGVVATQLARASGVEVVATASPRNHDFCKSLGASQVFDYTRPTIIDDIVAALDGKTVAGVYDTISDQKSQGLAAQVAEKFGARLILTLPKQISLVPSAVDTKEVWIMSIKDNVVANAVWSTYVPAALESGNFKAAPPAKVIGQGLEHIQAAMEANKKGLSAEKAVVKLL